MTEKWTIIKPTEDLRLLIEDGVVVGGPGEMIGRDRAWIRSECVRRGWNLRRG